ncbi:transposase [Humisphaera borealis]|uniref:transposase n=1 Tax=Humisphaera borealis TaxID=2807512 RepID=UPI0036F33E56
MVLASHVILSCYGFWLPNEERGSWSDFVRNWELFYRYGGATKVDTYRSVADKPYDRERRRESRKSLTYPPVEFSGVQAREVGLAFADKAQRANYSIHACAIMRNHVHLVIGRHRYDFLQIANLLKGAATTRLTQRNLHPLQQCRTPRGTIPSPWAHRCWVVFLDSEVDVRRAVKYVEDNPEKEGKKRQVWSCVVPYPAR